VSGGGAPQKSVTQLIADWSRGDPAALDSLMPLVYEELRRIASRQLAHERGPHTLPGGRLVRAVVQRDGDDCVRGSDGTPKAVALEITFVVSQAGAAHHVKRTIRLRRIPHNFVWFVKDC
jgi:hypothetical protein